MTMSIKILLKSIEKFKREGYYKVAVLECCKNEMLPDSYRKFFLEMGLNSKDASHFLGHSAKWCGILFDADNDYSMDELIYNKDELKKFYKKHSDVLILNVERF